MVNIQKTKQNFLITKSKKVYLDNLSFQESLVMNIKFLEFENKEELVLYSIKDVRILLINNIYIYIYL